MKLLIAETADFSPSVLSLLQQKYEVTFRDIEMHELSTCLNEYDVFWFRLKFNLTEELLNQARRCKYIVTPVTGINHIHEETCKAKNIKLITLKGESEFLKTVRATAEHTLGITLSLLRHINESHQSVKNGEWNRDLFKGFEIYGKKVGILGVGRLGKITASFFHALGADVYGYDVQPFESDCCKPVSTMEELFKTCNILSIHVNHTQANINLVRYEHMKMMPYPAFIINTSRGEILNSVDLVNALEHHILLGAAVDVLENEYHRENDVLIDYAKKYSNLLITPHIGGNTYESFHKTELFIAEKLIRESGI